MDGIVDRLRDSLRGREGSLIERVGDLRNFQQDAVMHGCNCFKTMGSGVAAALRARFPEISEADLRYDATPQERLGRFSFCILNNGQLGYNLYTQFRFGRDKRHLDYDALRRSFRGACEHLLRQGLRTIAMPRIGCGLAGGDWLLVREILRGIARKTGVVVTIYVPPSQPPCPKGRGSS